MTNTEYRVEIHRSAAKYLGRLDSAEYQRISIAISLLAFDPRPPGVRKIKGANEIYRIRVGGSRIIYRVGDGKLLVLVIRVGRRDQVYRNLDKGFCLKVEFWLWTRPKMLKFLLEDDPPEVS